MVAFLWAKKCKGNLSSARKEVAMHNLAYEYSLIKTSWIFVLASSSMMKSIAIANELFACFSTESIASNKLSNGDDLLPSIEFPQASA